MKKSGIWKAASGVAVLLFVALVGGAAVSQGNSATSQGESSGFVEESSLPQSSLSQSSSSTAQNVSMKFKHYASVTVGQLIEESTLVATCTYQEPSESFQILYTNGGGSTFTDHYFEVHETFRGEAPEDGIVAVRQEGGTIGNEVVKISPSCDFEEGKSYLLFLYHPSVGAGCNTEGEYYYLSGDVYGAYPIDDPSFSKVSGSQLVNEMGSNPIDVASFPQQVAYYNGKTSPEEDLVLQQSIENMEENVRAGMMTQEEYEKAIAELEEYATYVGDPPSGYSGQ